MSNPEVKEIDKQIEELDNKCCSEIEKINKKIRELNNKKTKLLAKEQESELKRLKSMEWIKDSFGTFGFYGKKNVTFTIELEGNVPKISEMTFVTLMKNKAGNVNFVSCDNKYSLEFNSAEILIQFLEKYRFKNLYYNNDFLKVLNLIKSSYYI